MTEDTFIMKLFWVKDFEAASSNEICYNGYLEQSISMLLRPFSISISASMASLSPCPPDNVLKTNEQWGRLKSTTSNGALWKVIQASETVSVRSLSDRSYSILDQP